MGLINFGILGSCVSRDAFEFIKNEASLSFYVARSSLVSIYSDPICVENEYDFIVHDDVNFSTKMVKMDLLKQSKSLLRNCDYDVLIIDLIDERFNIINVDGSFVTQSNYLIKTDFYKKLHDPVVIGSWSEKFRLWKLSVDKLVEDVGCRKLFLHRAKWADKYKNHDTGDIVNFGEPEISVVRKNNNYLYECYDYINKVFPSVFNIEPNENFVYSDFHHKWGRDYFHYGDDYYRDISRKIMLSV